MLVDMWFLINRAIMAREKQSENIKHKFEKKREANNEGPTIQY